MRTDMKTKTIICFLLILTLNGCKTDKKSYNTPNAFPMSHLTALDSINRPNDSTALYFPVSVNVAFKDSSQKHNYDTLYTKTASGYLYYLKEPILSSKYLGNDMYRVIYGFTFPPKTIRIIKEESKVHVIIKYGISTGIDLPCELNETAEYDMSLSCWDTLTVLAKKAMMWNPPKYRPQKATYAYEYFFEGHKEEGYTHLGLSNIEKDINLKEAKRLLKYFLEIEAKNPNK
jgi:hypothetical protein